MKKPSTHTLLQALQVAERSVARERTKRLANIDLTSAQAQILATLQQTGPISLNNLASQLLTDTPPSRVVSTLVNRQLVKRRDQASDRRYVDLELSARGKQKTVEIRRVEQAIQRWAKRKLTRMPIQAAHKALIALADGA